MSQLSDKIINSDIPVLPGTNNLEDHLGYQFADILSHNGLLFPDVQKYATDIQRIYEEMRENPEFQSWYNKAYGIQPRGMMWTQMLQHTVRAAKQELSLSQRDQITLDKYCQAFIEAMQTPGNGIITRMCISAAKHSTEPGFILLAQENNHYAPCDFAKFVEVTNGTMDEFKKACHLASQFHRYVTKALEEEKVCITADTAYEIIGTVQEFDNMFLLQIAHAKSQHMPHPVETAAARITMELALNAGHLIHNDFVYGLQKFVPQMLQENHIHFSTISWEAGGNDSYEAMLNINSYEFQCFLNETEQYKEHGQYHQEHAKHKDTYLMATLPVSTLSEQILTRVHGLADAYLENKDLWNQFHQDYQGRFLNRGTNDYQEIARAAALAAGNLMVDQGWCNYLHRSGLDSTTHLFEYLVSEITENHILHGGVYTEPGSQEETYLNLYSHTLDVMPLGDRADFATRLVEEAEREDSVMQAGINAYNAWASSRVIPVSEHVAAAFESDLSAIQRDELVEQL